MNDTADRKVLEWFEHVKRVNGDRLTHRLSESEVEGGKDRGRLCMRLRDGVKKACNTRSLELRDTMMKCMDREQSSEFMNCINGGMKVSSMARILPMRDNEGVDSNITGSAVIESLGRAEPFTNGVKPSFAVCGSQACILKSLHNICTIKEKSSVTLGLKDS